MAAAPATTPTGGSNVDGRKSDVIVVIVIVVVAVVAIAAMTGAMSMVTGRKLRGG